MTHLNVRSFNKNSDEFIAFVKRYNIKIEIMFYTETWCKHDSVAEIWCKHHSVAEIWFQHDIVAEIEGHNSYHVYRSKFRMAAFSRYKHRNINPFY